MKINYIPLICLLATIICLLVSDIYLYTENNKLFNQLMLEKQKSCQSQEVIFI